MKALFLFVIVTLYSVFVHCQSFSTDSTGNILYESVIQVDSLSKSEIHSLLNVWIAKTYITSNDAIQLNDKEAGIIIVNGKFNIQTQYAGVKQESIVLYQIVFRLKDNRFKYSISKLTVIESSGNKILLTNTKPQGWPTKFWNQFQVETIKAVTILEEDIKNISISQTENW